MNENEVFEAINSTDLIVNTTENQPFFQINYIPDVNSIFAFMQDKISNLLISWNFIPEDIYLKIILIFIPVLILYQLFVSGSSKIGGAFKWVLMAVLVAIILVALEIL